MSSQRHAAAGPTHERGGSVRAAGQQPSAYPNIAMPAAAADATTIPPEELRPAAKESQDWRTWAWSGLTSNTMPPILGMEKSRPDLSAAVPHLFGPARHTLERLSAGARNIPRISLDVWTNLCQHWSGFIRIANPSIFRVIQDSSP